MFLFQEMPAEGHEARLWEKLHGSEFFRIQESSVLDVFHVLVPPFL